MISNLSFLVSAGRKNHLAGLRSIWGAVLCQLCMHEDPLVIEQWKKFQVGRLFGFELLGINIDLILVNPKLKPQTTTATPKEGTSVLRSE